ncbi:hypothetical protein [Pseudomonas sp. CLCA07]
MCLPLFLKSFLVVMLFNGVAVFNAQTASFSNENSHISKSCDALSYQANSVLEAHSGSELLTFGRNLCVHSMISDLYFASTQSVKLSSVIHQPDPTCDDLVAAITNDQVMVDQNVQETGLTGTSNQPKAVALSALAWLFFSALFGFVAVANRRKV